jgi:hypothetical protein
MLGKESYPVNTSHLNIQLLNWILNPIMNELLEFTNELFFISSGEPNRSYWSLVSVVAETPGDP